jgi:two-component system response regulator PfeR
MQFPHPTPAPSRLLVIEDDSLLADHLCSHLRQRHFAVSWHDTLQGGMALAARETFELILMDIMLPDGSGLDALARLRQSLRVPIILMSALGAEQDRIVGYSQGADDYLPKPFSMAELDVRIDALRRRIAYEREPRPVVETKARRLGLELDALNTDARLGGRSAGLTGAEFRILELLVQTPDEPVGKSFLYQQALHRPYSHHDRSLDMHVSHIRRKLQAIGYTAARLETIRGLGYMLKRSHP